MFWATVIQIGVVDIVFSLDSVITAVGMVNIRARSKRLAKQAARPE